VIVAVVTFPKISNKALFMSALNDCAGLDYAGLMPSL
jgi:hypothetical protein